jgi:hypothetical protein
LFYKSKERNDDQHQVTPFDSSRHQEPSEKQGEEGGHPAPASDNRISVLAPSEIDSREVRIPISPQNIAHLSPNTSSFQRDDTCNTLYPHARPNYTNTTDSLLPQSPGASTVVSNPADYSEWSVTPHLQQHRWSGTIAQDSGVSATMGSIRGSDAGNRSDEPVGHHAQEVMGWPRIPSTIAELP